MQEARDRSIGGHALQPAFKSHILCLWEDGETAKQWLSPAILDACREKNIKMGDFRTWLVGEHEV